jgi:FkbM family methyltransferase
MSLAARVAGWIKVHKRSAGVLGGLRRLLVRLWKLGRLVPLLNRLTLPVLVDGHWMYVRAFSYDDLLTVSDDYEQCLADLLPPRGGVAVDGGAFIGRHTLCYARAVGPTGRVLAVEPLQANFRLLTRNVARNGYSHVACVECALGKQEGEVLLAYDWETSTATVARDLPHKIRAVQHTLGEALRQQGLDRLDFLKLDVEGAEQDVLEGAASTLAANPQATLAIEVHGFDMHGPAGAGQESALADWLTSRGYDIERRMDGRRLFFVARKRSKGY